MDNKYIALTAIVIAVVACVGGYMILSDHDSSDKNDNIIGEWTAMVAGGYNEDGKYFNTEDREVLKNFDIEILDAQNGVVVVKVKGMQLNGTINDKMIKITGVNGDNEYVITANITDVMSLTFTRYNSVNGTYVANCIYTQGKELPGERPTVKDLPKEWQSYETVVFNGITSPLGDVSLKIVEQNYRSFIGTVTSPLSGGADIVVKGIIRNPDSTDGYVIDAIGDNNTRWILYYSFEKQTVTSSSLMNIDGQGVSVAVKLSQDGKPVEDSEPAEYLGMTWAGEGKWTVDGNGKIVETTDPSLTFNITSQNGRQISGTVTSATEVVFDFEGLINPYGFTYMMTTGFNSITGNAVVSSDLKTVKIYEDFWNGDTTAIYGGYIELAETEPADGNEFLGEWTVQYATAIIDGEFKTYPEWEDHTLTVNSVKGGLFVGTYWGGDITGTLVENKMGFICTYEYDGHQTIESVYAYIDDKGTLQVFSITRNEASSTVWNILCTRGEYTEDVAAGFQLSESYSESVGSLYDGNVVSDLGDATITIDQHGSLFNATLTLYSEGGEPTETMELMGYITDDGKGSLLGPEEGIVVVTAFDGKLFLHGSLMDDVFFRVFSNETIVVPDIDDMATKWDATYDSTMNIDGLFVKEESDWTLEITDQQKMFISVKRGDYDSGLGVLIPNGGAVLFTSSDDQRTFTNVYISEDSMICIERGFDKSVYCWFTATA